MDYLVMFAMFLFGFVSAFGLIALFIWYDHRKEDNVPYETEHFFGGRHE